MYLELWITAEYGSKQALITKLIQEIGVNLVPAQAAVQETVFWADAASVVPRVVAAEQIQNKTFILYFLQGSDTINVHLVAPTVAETKQQADRIAKRTCTLFEEPTGKTKTKAVIYVVTSQGFDTAIICGRRIGHWRKFMDAFLERWLPRVATPAIVFFSQLYFCPALLFPGLLFLRASQPGSLC